jgi:protein-L-isoaspartate O-methyltransferase
LASKYGQYKTIKNWTCLDASSVEIPWYTYPSIEYLNNIDFSKKSVLEYGSGNSSKYWSRRARDIVSIEDNKDWYQKANLGLKENQTVLLKEDSDEYEGSIKTLDKKFDVIIIDGIRRAECARVINGYLNIDSREGGMVILDNSDWYKETSKFLRENLDLIEIDFHGFGPINNYTWTTSIFFSRNFNFKPVDNSQPNFSLAGIRKAAE